jgi:hypothetical protein
MDSIEKQILAALDELDQTVKRLPSMQPKPDLQPLFGRLEELARQLPKGSDPNLLHYLNNKSYEKARLLLQGRDSENARGACGCQGPRSHAV